MVYLLGECMMAMPGYPALVLQPLSALFNMISTFGTDMLLRIVRRGCLETAVAAFKPFANLQVPPPLGIEMLKFFPCLAESQNPQVRKALSLSQVIPVLFSLFVQLTKMSMAALYNRNSTSSQMMMMDVG